MVIKLFVPLFYYAMDYYTFMFILMVYDIPLMLLRKSNYFWHIVYKFQTFYEFGKKKGNYGGLL